MNIPCEQHYHDDLHDPFAAHFLQQSVCGVWGCGGRRISRKFSSIIQLLVVWSEAEDSVTVAHSPALVSEMCFLMNIKCWCSATKWHNSTSRSPHHSGSGRKYTNFVDIPSSSKQQNNAQKVLKVKKPEILNRFCYLAKEPFTYFYNYLGRHTYALLLQLLI